jgi:hypothetical protein
MILIYMLFCCCTGSQSVALFHSLCALCSSAKSIGGGGGGGGYGGLRKGNPGFPFIFILPYGYLAHVVEETETVFLNF